MRRRWWWKVLLGGLTWAFGLGLLPDLHGFVAVEALGWTALVVTATALWLGRSGRGPRLGSPIPARLAPKETGALVDLFTAGKVPVPIPTATYPSLAVLGPSGSGKTHLLGLMASCWHGPVLLASTKPDLLDLALEARQALAARLGEPPELQVWDPAGLSTSAVRVAWDPSVVPTGQDPQDHAHRAAHALLDQQRSGGAAAFWAARGENLLAPILTWANAVGGVGQALAALAGGDLVRTIAQASEAVEHDPHARAVLQQAAAALADANASRLARDELATALAALQPWASPGLRAPLGTQVLDLGRWARSWAATVAVIVPAHQASAWAPAVQAVLEDAVTSLRGARGGLVPALLILDEVANIAPLPNLGTWATEVRGWGAHLVVGLQASRQATRWDQHDPTGWLMQHFPRLLAAAGAPEHDLAERVSVAHGMADVKRFSTSWSSNGASTTQHWERRRALEPDQVLAGTAKRSPGTRQWVEIVNGKRGWTWTLEPAPIALAQVLMAAAQEREGAHV